MARLTVPDRLPGIADAHAHLQHEAFAHDLDEVLARARAAGVTRILVPGWDRASSESALELSVRHPDLLDAAAGIHPHYVGSATEADWAAIDALAQDDGVRAVGELGLDFYRNLSPPDVQRDALGRQLALAARAGKPVVVHDREAHAEITSALLDHATLLRGARSDAAPDSRVAGLLHAFSGDVDMAMTLASAGYLISFALPVSFAGNRGPREAAARLPATHVLLETDSPYLGVSPDQRNEPTTTLRVAAVLGQLRGVEPATIAAAAATAVAELLD